MALLRILIVVLATCLFGTIAIVVTLPWPRGPVFFTLARAWSRLVLRTCRARMTVLGHTSVPLPGPVLYMSNHQSLLDVPGLILALPEDCRFVAKRELGHIPVFGWALRAAGFVFVDRADRQRAIESLDRAAGMLRRGGSVLVFAEGTRSPDGRLLPFKKGGFVLALKAGVPIVPVAVRGGAALLPKGSFRSRPGTMTVIFGAPVDTSGFSMENKEVLMETVRERITALLELPPNGRRGEPALR